MDLKDRQGGNTMEEIEFEFGQEPLGDFILQGSKTNADVVFVIDATASMQPILDKVKNYALKLYDDIRKGLQDFNKEINQFRVKVIAFRDYYCDGIYAMQESEFFYLPMEAVGFQRYIASIEAKGGGDRPENSLEAIALAMKSDWTEEGNSRRHIIVLFTDAPAHPLEQAKQGVPKNYPKGMLTSYGSLVDAWGQGSCIEELSRYNMDKRAKRLILFVPDEEPWEKMQEEFEQCVKVNIRADEGGAELNSSLILDTLCRSMS